VNRHSEVAYREEEEMVAVLTTPPLMTLFFLGLGVSTCRFSFSFFIKMIWRNSGHRHDDVLSEDLIQREGITEII
jgi:hypothetical protein